MIGIINYGLGNIASLQYALSDLGAKTCVSAEIAEFEACEKLILPGVGHAGYAMQELEKRGLVDFIKSTQKPLLGICLGMQLLFEASEETDLPLLGLLSGKLKKFEALEKFPQTHMAWNSLNTERDVYFVHSYYAPIVDETKGRCNYQTDFTAVVQKDNLLGYQFHPEKSGEEGKKYLQEFLDM